MTDMYKFFGIKEIKDDLIICNDNSMYSILDIPIIKTGSVMKKYAEYLKKINYPIRIITRILNENSKEKIDLIDSKFSYLLEKKKKQSLLREYSKFSSWIRGHIKKNCKLTKKCYLVIPYQTIVYRSTKKKQYAVGRQVINKRIEDFRNEFNKMRFKRLTDPDLLNLCDSFLKETFYIKDAYHPLSSFLENKNLKQELRNYLTQTETLEVDSNYLKIGDTYMKGLVATGYPKYINKKFLRPILSFKNNVDMSLHITPIAVAQLENYLLFELDEVKDKIFKLNKKGRVAKRLNTEKRKISRILKQLDTNKLVPFEFSFYLLVSGKNLDELNNITKRVISLLKSKDVIIKPATNYQQSLLKSISPIDIEGFFKPREIILTSDILSNNIPFVK